MPELSRIIRSTIRRSPISWAHACHIHLRPYQVQIAQAVKESIIHNLGLTFVVILPRQSGKNELQAHLFAWAMYRYAHAGGRIVSVSPTFKPQTQLCMDRVKSSLNACVGSRGLWKSSKGYSYTLGNAQLQFFSGEPRANVLGATADLLLSVDEAQSVSMAKFDKDFDPMTASTNATRIFWGTAWTSDTLLERERRIALRSQRQDGIQRLFYFTADDVRGLVPAYGKKVDNFILAMGRNHPIVRSQYFCETIDAQAGMFNASRLALLQADPIPATTHTPATGSLKPLSKSAGFGEGLGVGLIPTSQTPVVGSSSGPGAASLPLSPTPCSSSPSSLPSGEDSAGVSFLLDVAGMDESRLNPLHSTGYGLGNPGRDSTALTIVQIDLSSLSALGHPTYHVVARHSWVGENHLAVFGKLKALADTWHPRHIVIDATGVGEGLWALLDRAFPARVIPVKFSQTEKSEIGWRFLSIIETGRFRDHVHSDEVHLQYSRCISEILPGPMKTLRWGVPDGARGPDGELIHDDFILADALTAKLDELEWYYSLKPAIIHARDPLLDYDNHFRKSHKDEFDHYYSRPDAL